MHNMCPSRILLRLKKPGLDLTDSVGASCTLAVWMMAWPPAGTQALRLRRTATRLRGLTAHLAQAERATMPEWQAQNSAALTQNAIPSDAVGQVKS